MPTEIVKHSQTSRLKRYTAPGEWGQEWLAAARIARRLALRFAQLRGLPARGPKGREC
jgi:hypothetical protein